MIIKQYGICKAVSTGSKNTSAKNTHVEMFSQAQLQVHHCGGLAHTSWGQFGI